MSSCAVAVLLMDMRCISKLDAGIMQCNVQYKSTVHGERQTTEPINLVIENPALICG
jgi:hypothetical protein